MAAVGDLRTLFCNSDVNQLQEAENAIRLNEKKLYLLLLSSSCSVDLEKKKEELRQLVGKRYRDIIDAADNIKAMTRDIEEVCERNALFRSFSPSQIYSSISVLRESMSSLEERQQNLSAALYRQSTAKTGIEETVRMSS